MEDAREGLLQEQEEEVASLIEELAEEISVDKDLVLSLEEINTVVGETTQALREQQKLDALSTQVRSIESELDVKRREKSRAKAKQIAQEEVEAAIQRSVQQEEEDLEAILYILAEVA